MVADKCVSGAGSSTTTRRVLSERTPSSQVPTKFLQLVRLCTYSKTSGQESYNEALAVMLGRFLVFLFGFSEGRKVPSASQPASASKAIVNPWTTCSKPMSTINIRKGDNPRYQTPRRSTFPKEISPHPSFVLKVPYPCNFPM